VRGGLSFLCRRAIKGVKIGFSLALAFFVGLGWAWFCSVSR
jgi:hypothetical protein